MKLRMSDFLASIDVFVLPISVSFLYCDQTKVRVWVHTFSRLNWMREILSQWLPHGVFSSEVSSIICEMQLLAPRLNLAGNRACPSELRVLNHHCAGLGIINLTSWESTAWPRTSCRARCAQMTSFLPMWWLLVSVLVCLVFGGSTADKLFNAPDFPLALLIVSWRMLVFRT